MACAKDTVRTDSAGEAQDSAWTQTRFLDRNVTNDHEQPRFVPLVPMLFGGVKTPSKHYIQLLPPPRVPSYLCGSTAVCVEANRFLLLLTGGNM